MLAKLFNRSAANRFTGGIVLPERKSLSNQAELKIAPLPAELTHPLGQHIGAAAKPSVAVGDRVLRGQRIGEAVGPVSADVHAASSGSVVAIEPRQIAHVSGLMAPCVVIATDGKDERAEPLEHTDSVISLTPEQIRERLRAAGIVGLGGAAFPSAIKLNTRGRAIDTLVLNGAECESYITCDDMLARIRPDEIIAAVPIFRQVLEAQNLPVIIALEDHMVGAVAALRAALEKSGLRRVEVRAVPSVYPEGGEKQLIQTLTGREVPTGGLPLDIGIVCQNIGTAAAAYRAIVHGEALTSRIVTVTGEAITNPGNYEVRLGSSVADVVAAAGGYKGAPARLIMGGAMMGFALRGDDVPMVKATNCILAASEMEVRPDDSTVMPCIRCGECAEVCPASLLPQQLYWYSRSKEFDKAKSFNLFDCIECGACAQACPSHIPLVQYYRYAKAEIWTEEREKSKADIARERHESRLARIERAEQEKRDRQKQRQTALEATKTADSSDVKPKANDPVAAALAKAKASAANSTVDGNGVMSAVEKAKAKARERQQAEAGLAGSTDKDNKPSAASAAIAAAKAKAQKAKTAAAGNANADQPTEKKAPLSAVELAKLKAQAAAKKAAKANLAQTQSTASGSEAKSPAQIAIEKARQAKAKAAAEVLPTTDAVPEKPKISPAEIAKLKAAAAAKKSAAALGNTAPEQPADAIDRTPEKESAKSPAEIAKLKAQAAIKKSASTNADATVSAKNEQQAELTSSSEKPKLSPAEIAKLKAQAAVKKAAKAEASSVNKQSAGEESPAQLAIERAKQAAKKAATNSQDENR